MYSIEIEICNNSSFLSVVQVILNVIKLICTIVPILAIVFITIDFGKTLLSETVDDNSKILKLVIKRLIFCVAVFIVPTLINATMLILDNIGVDFSECITNATTEKITELKEIETEEKQKIEKEKQSSNKDISKNDYSSTNNSNNSSTNNNSSSTNNNNSSTKSNSSSTNNNNSSTKSNSSSTNNSNSSSTKSNNSSTTNRTTCYNVAAKSENSRVILKEISTSDIQRSITVPNVQCEEYKCSSSQSLAIKGNIIYVYKEAWRKTTGNQTETVDGAVLTFDLNTSRELTTYHIGSDILGHGNGMTLGRDGKIYVIPMVGKNNLSFTTKNNEIIITKKGNTNNKDVLGINNVSGIPTKIASIAYDKNTNLYYLGIGDKLLKYDDKNKKVINKIKRHHNVGQDIHAYNGIILSGQYKASNEWYIDLYRAKDMVYIGSYKLKIPGELEGIGFWNGKLITVSNVEDKIHIFKPGTIDFNNDCK